MKKLTKVPKLKILEFLNRISLFKSLEPVERELVAKIPNLIVVIEKGSVFIRKNHFDSDFYILLNGDAEISVNGQKIASATAGSFIGEVGFICNEARSATVTAENTLIAMRITRDLFDLLPLKVRESIKQKIINGLVERITAQNSRIISLEEKVETLEHELYPEQFTESDDVVPQDNLHDANKIDKTSENSSHVLDINPVD